MYISHVAYYLNTTAQSGVMPQWLEVKIPWSKTDTKAKGEQPIPFTL